MGFSCPSVFNPPPSLCSPEHHLIISLQNLESYYGNRFQPFPPKRIPPGLGEITCLVAIQLFVLLPFTSRTLPVTYDLEQHLADSGWGLGPLSSIPLPTPPRPAFTGCRFSPEGGHTAKSLYKNTWIFFFNSCPRI